MIHFLALVILTGYGIGNAAEPVTVRAALQPAHTRSPASDFELQDAEGKTARLKDYKGRVLLLDFWATWCGGCKEEIPWFAEFEKPMARKVSLLSECRLMKGAGER